MAFPRLWNPGMGGLVQDQPTRLRMPIPGVGNPYTSTPALQRSIVAGGPPQGRLPSPKSPFPIPAPAPSPQRPQSPALGIANPNQAFQEEYVKRGMGGTAKPEVTPFMTTIYKSIQNIDPEQRGEYLSTTAASIKDRMDRFEFRIARGIPLSPEMQRQYESLRGAYNDIQKYINNPKPYDDLFGEYAANIEGVRQRNMPFTMERQTAQGRMYQGV